MKKVLIILGLALFAATTMPTYAMTIIQKPAGYITVHATETMEVVPNTANILFSIETTDVDSRRASERNSQISSKAIISLKEQLINDKTSQVQTKNFTLRPNYKNNNNAAERVIKNYTAINTVQVKTSDVSLVSILIDTAIKNGVTNVNGVELSIENVDEYSAEISKEAIQKAKDIAQTTVANFNQKIKGIKTLRVNVYNQSSNSPRLYAAKYTSAGEINSDASTPIETGKIKIYASVDAEFYVK